MYSTDQIEIYNALGQSQKAALKKWVLAKLGVFKTPTTMGIWFKNPEKVPSKIGFFESEDIKKIMLEGLVKFTEAEKQKAESRKQEAELIQKEAKKKVKTFTKYLQQISMLN